MVPAINRSVFFWDSNAPIILFSLSLTIIMSVEFKFTILLLRILTKSEWKDWNFLSWSINAVGTTGFPGTSGVGLPL